MKFIAVVLACGLYANDQSICLAWTDQHAYATHEACMARAQEIVRSVKTLTLYARVKLAKAPVPSCRQN